MVAAAVVLLAAGNARSPPNAAARPQVSIVEGRVLPRGGGARHPPRRPQWLANTRYSTKTIYADRNQKSFKLSLDQFMAKRGGPHHRLPRQGMKQQNAALFSASSSASAFLPGR